MSFLKGLVTLTWSPVGGVCPTACEQWPFPCSLPSFWPLPYPAPFRELGLSVFRYSTCWPPRVSLPPGCLGAVVKSEGLERTPPLLGLLSFCQLNRAWLAHLAVHGMSGDLDLLPAWVPEGEGLGNLLVGCGSFPVAAGGNARGKKVGMNLVLGQVVLRERNGWQSQEVRENWPVWQKQFKLLPVGGCLGR